MSNALTVCTLADRRFLPGLAGLINSLRAAQFSGQIIVGVPEPLEELKGLPNVTPVVVGAEGMWIGCLKPLLLLQHVKGPFAFLDADIVVGSGLIDALPALIDHAPVLALEGLVNSNDPRRLRWARRLKTPPARQAPWEYYNSGFLAGHLPRDRALLERWLQLMREMLPSGVSHFADADFPFPDQDILNIVLHELAPSLVALQYPDWWSSVAPLNPFLHVGAFPEPLFYHSIGAKPWELTAVPSRMPSTYERRWFGHAVTDATPLRIFCELPRDVQRWLQGSWSGRIQSRGNRLKEKLGVR